MAIGSNGVTMNRLGVNTHSPLMPGMKTVSQSVEGEMHALACELDRGSQHDAQDVTAAEMTARLLVVLEANRSKLKSCGNAGHVDRLNALPDPAAAVSGNRLTWNEALAALFSKAADPRAAITNELEPIRRIFDQQRVSEMTPFLYPLGDQVFALRTMRSPGSDLKLAYFLHTGLRLRSRPFFVRFVACARLSGLAAKQIARLCDVNVFCVEKVSKSHRADVSHLKQQMAANP